MARLNIRKIGDPVLRMTSRPVQIINNRIITLLDDMAQTKREADGCGLAAPQVGVLRRMLSVLEKYRVEQCYYGHLHGPTIRRRLEGKRGNTDFSLISADYLGFIPKKICEI